MNMQANTVAVVDYGMGNLRSVSQAVKEAAKGSGWQVVVTADPDVVRAADRVVLPGQGAMPDCMRELRTSGLQEPVLEAARNARANALNTDSHWWWALKPLRLSMCSVMPAWFTKPWKNS